MSERASLRAAPDLRNEIELFIHFSPWAADVPDVPETPPREWGTLAWARLALALLERYGDLLEAGSRVAAYHQAGGDEWWDAHSKLYQALNELGVETPYAS